MPMQSEAPTTQNQHRCLIVERHNWETGINQEQLQFVLDTANTFFGSGRLPRRIQVRIYLPANAANPISVKDISISREYSNGTRRTNGFSEMGSIPSSFVFFQETDQSGIYDFWWQTDKAIVAARFPHWVQGRNNQYGRGRLSIIVNGPVPRIIDQL